MGYHSEGRAGVMGYHSEGTVQVSWGITVRAGQGKCHGVSQ